VSLHANHTDYVRPTVSISYDVTTFGLW